MKRECKTCTHYVPGRTHEAYTGSDMSSMIYGVYGSDSPYCLKHRSMDIGRGCDDFWPRDSDPRCNECRFFVETVGGDLHEGRCMHSSMQTENRLGVINATGYCENWRAR